MSLLKPSTQTPFKIDFDWWVQNDRDWHVYMRSLLCPEHQLAFSNVQEDTLIDWIDPLSAEVKEVDGIQNALMSHCALQPDFVNSHTAMVEAVFRVLLANGNQPMSAADLSQKLNRPAEIILRTLTGPRIYRGLRPLNSSKPAEKVDAVPVAEEGA